MRGLKTVAGVLLTATALVACGGDDDGGGGGASAGAVKDIKVTVSSATEPFIIPWLVGREQGLFRKHGVNITEIIPGQGGSTTLRTVLSGDLPLGEVGLTAVIEGKLAGTPIKAVGGAVRTAYGFDFYALASGPIKQPTDAKKWAFSNKGSVTEAMTYLVPEALGIDPSTIEHVDAGGLGEGVALLEAGDVDVTVVPPTVVAQDPDKYRLIARGAEAVPSLQTSVMTVREDYLAENSEVIEGILAGYAEAVAAVKKDPELATRLYAEDVGLPEAEARKIVDFAVKADNWSAGVQSEDLSNLQKAMQSAGFEGEIPWCELFDLSHLPSGAPKTLPVTCEK